MEDILKAFEKLRRDLSALEKLVSERICQEPKPTDAKDDGYKAIAVQVMEYFNRECNSNFSINAKSNITPIVARLKQGRSFEDFKLVILDRKEKWGKDPKMCDYIRPSTLFSPTNFENYLNSAKKSKNINQNKSFDSTSVESEILRRIAG